MIRKCRIFILFLILQQSKYFIIDTAYRLHAAGMANKYVASVDNYLTDQLDYNYHLLQSSPGM